MMTGEVVQPRRLYGRTHSIDINADVNDKVRTAFHVAARQHGNVDKRVERGGCDVGIVGK